MNLKPISRALFSLLLNIRTFSVINVVQAGGVRVGNGAVEVEEM